MVLCLTCSTGAEMSFVDRRLNKLCLSYLTNISFLIQDLPTVLGKLGIRINCNFRIFISDRDTM